MYCFMYMSLTFVYMYIIKYRPCMIANIPLATENRLNCFIRAREMLSIIVYNVLFQTNVHIFIRLSNFKLLCEL